MFTDQCQTVCSSLFVKTITITTTNTASFTYCSLFGFCFLTDQFQCRNEQNCVTVSIASAHTQKGLQLLGFLQEKPHRGIVYSLMNASNSSRSGKLAKSNKNTF